MKRLSIVLLVTLTALAGLSGCNVITGAGSTTSTTDLASLGMTPQQIEQWQSQGIANLRNPAAASVLAGFDVLTPTYLPPGVELAAPYMVSTNAPMLRRTNSDAPVSIHVQQVWRLPGDAPTVMLLDQSNRPFSHGQPVETTLSCGATVLKGSDINSSGAFAGATDLDLTDVPVHGLTGADFDQVVCSIIKQ
jgi:predicted small secreted protein